MYPDIQLFIDGEWRDAQSGKTIDVVDPASEEVIGRISHAERGDLDLAIEAASKGFKEWRDTSVMTRYQVMRRAAQLLRERADKIAAVMTLEQGKPVDQAKGEVLAGADVIDWFAEEGRRAYGQVIPSRDPSVQQLAVKQPVGPVAAFTPWNFPINQVVRKLSAALAVGCSIIVKAPEETPAAPAELIRAFADAGVPAGVVNLVYGVPAEISEYLIPHPAIRKISFTGSTAIGKQLAALAGSHMKRATMELGGHAPVIVCADADVELAAREMATAKFRNCGQVCISPTRFLVEDAVYDTFVARFLEVVEKLKVGRGDAEGVTVGPLANERRIPALESLIQDAREHGAKLLAGGERLPGKGYFFAPTVLGEVPLTARVMSEEPFGPLALINRVSSLDEAIEEANRLPYGLAAYAYTRGSANAMRLSREVETGMLTINHVGLALPELPFGGVKDSGYGSEGGSEAIDAYLVTKLVTHKAV
ncbi:NAD-dependent succinate-semialdehyde dehydrogenase [Halotalea alkalilenta]|uniref:NAD-dependent succinate-semialdehyde dehydrogenase n=1 Tax=Halotalea alkalilenta TaxID=376489 RepID=A0A172YJ27_9GAMM|nr:NAD-dependent succinate-semialdehyde dehydrogenase [Halotalea alkalilenta]ANF59213.1 NAD-dependent succinate-semialdehyde dehydrogenase [Halotalea alkalilenta]